MNKHEPGPGKWSAGICLAKVTYGFDPCRAPIVELWSWRDCEGLVHLSSICPLPWVLRDLLTAGYIGFPQRWLMNAFTDQFNRPTSPGDPSREPGDKWNLTSKGWATSMGIGPEAQKALRVGFGSAAETFSRPVAPLSAFAVDDGLE